LSKFSLGVIFTLIGGICWGASGTIAQYLFLNSYDTQWVSFYRLLFSGLILCVFSFRFRNLKLFVNPKELLSLVIFGVFGLLLTQFSYFQSISYTDAGTATMFQYTAPTMIMLISCMYFKKFPSFKEILALGLSLIGIFLLASKGSFSSLKLNFWGSFWGLLSAVGTVFYSLSAVKLIHKYGVSFILGFASLIGALTLFLLADEDFLKYKFNLELSLAMSAIILFGTIAAFGLYLQGVEFIGPVRASMIACIEPLAAAFFTWAFLHTFYTKLDLFSFSLIILSVILVAKRSD